MNRHFARLAVVCAGVVLGGPSLVACADQFADTGEKPSVFRPLSPPSDRAEPTGDSQSPTGSFVTTLGALGLILMIFLGLVQMWKKRVPQSSRRLPEDVWQELGGARLDHRFQVRLVRVGSRVLVIGQSDTSLQTLSEITSAEEVATLVAQCGPSRDDGHGQKSRFHSLYEQFRSRIDSPETDRPMLAGLSSRESHGE